MARRMLYVSGELNREGETEMKDRLIAKVAVRNGSSPYDASYTRWQMARTISMQLRLAGKRDRARFWDRVADRWLNAAVAFEG